MTPDRLDDWHRLFGLTLTDVFSGTPSSPTNPNRNRWTAGRWTN